MLSMRHHYSEKPVDTKTLSLWGLGVHERIARKCIHRPMGISCFLLLYFYDAVGFEEDAVATPCPGSTFIIIKPGQSHRFGTLERTWDHSWLLVGGSCIRRFLRENEIPVDTPVQAPVASFLEKALFEMHREVSMNLKPQASYLKNIMHNLFIDIGRACAAKERAPAIPEAFLAVRAYIQGHFTRALTLAQLARRTHLSVPRFATRFKACFGISPIEFQISLRLERACFLLNDANLGIGEIARAVGYSNVHYFSRLFRKRFGLPASRMRAGKR